MRKLAFLLILLFLPFTVLAVTDTVEESAGITPENPFYFMDSGFDWMDYQLAIGSEFKAKRAAYIAEEKLSEMVVIYNHGSNAKKINASIASHDKYIERLAKNLDQVSDDEFDYKVMAQIQQKISVHAQRVAMLQAEFHLATLNIEELSKENAELKETFAEMSATIADLEYEISTKAEDVYSAQDVSVEDVQEAVADEEDSMELLSVDINDTEVEEYLEEVEEAEAEEEQIEETEIEEVVEEETKDDTLIIRDDDGSKETILQIDFADDKGTKYLDIPEDMRYATAHLWVYARNKRCEQGSTADHILSVNGHNIYFDPCKLFQPKNQWKYFNVPTEYLKEGTNSFVFSDPQSHWETTNLFMAVDQSTDKGKSIISTNTWSPHSKPIDGIKGELMIYLKLNGVKVEEPELDDECAAGWKCYDNNTKAYQSSNCSWDELFTCTYGDCESGECTTDITCVDSDGGKSYYVLGQIIYGDVLKTDNCIENGGKLVEYFCQTINDTWDQMTYECSDGSCVSGICTNNTIETNDTCTAGYVCDGEMQMKYIQEDCTEDSSLHMTCTNGPCVNGVCTDTSTNSTFFCSDTDNGRNYYEKGTCSDSTGEVSTDYCGSNNYITEFSCNEYQSGKFDCSSISTDCPDGNICNDGACVSETATNDTIVEGGVTASCRGPEGWYCINYSMKAYQHDDLYDPATDIRNDDCIFTEYTSCEYGCDGGACLESHSGCTDTDPLSDRYVKGLCTAKTGGTAWDYCYDDNWVHDYGCQPTGWCTPSGYQCPNGCNNGMCIEEEEEEPVVASCDSISDDGFCPSFCSPGVDVDCCTDEGYCWYEGHGCYTSCTMGIGNDCTLNSVCSSSVPDGCCPSWCSAGVDADCCTNNGMCVINKTGYLGCYSC